MKKGIIITLPRHDDVTEYLFQFSKEIEKTISEKGINIKILKDDEANKEEFEKVVNKLNYKMIIFNGHGSNNEINGQKGFIISLGINHNLLKERIVYARSCNAGAELGKACTENTKEGCFIGYDRPFHFYVDTLRVGNPLKDNTAKLFLEPSNFVPISLIKGNSTGMANENSKNNFLKI